MKTKDLVICGLFASITSVLAQIAIPFPGGVPLTLQTLAMSLTGIILGSKRGFIAQGLYVILGAIGMPIFANFTGGLQILLGPTGGFILSFPIMTYIIGYICERKNSKIYIVLAIIIGNIVNYSIGVIQFSFITKSTIIQSFIYCIVPFVIGDILKIICATSIGMKIKSNKSIEGVLN